jgi:hypothetical protein
MPPHQPVPITPTLICFKKDSLQEKLKPQRAKRRAVKEKQLTWTPMLARRSHA